MMKAYDVVYFGLRIPAKLKMKSFGGETVPGAAARLFYAWDAISFTTMAAGPVSHGNAQVLDPWRRVGQPALLFM